MQLNAGDPPATVASEPVAPRLSWYQRFGILLFVVFCFELGMFLLVFPWLRAWDVSWFTTVSPQLRELWVNPFFRGGLSGLGLVNIYISLLEIGRLRRP